MILLSFLIATYADAATPIWMNIGDVRDIPAAPTAQVRVGRRGIIRVLDGAQRGIRLIALKSGETALAIDRKSYLVRVATGRQREFVSRLESWLKTRLGLRLRVDEAMPVIEGKLFRFSDWLELSELAREVGGRYEFRAQAWPDVATKALEHFQAQARRRGFPLLRFDFDPTFTARLPKAATALRSAVDEEFSPFGIRTAMSDSNLQIEPLIRTRVILAEIERSHSQQLGLHWPTSYQAQVLPSVKTDEQLMVQLNALEQNGDAQILAEPNLLCRSGGEARFHAGGEFPIRVVGHRSRDVVWKSHGVLLRVKPKADFHGALSLEIETEISLLDHAHSVDGLPALKVNSVKSHFDLPGRRTIALSGLLREDRGGGREGLPYLSGLPIIGRLFSSRSWQEHRSELVVFVTPEVFTAESDEKLAFPKGWVTHAN